MHALEKYMKSVLLKNDPDIKVRKLNHNILKLWDENRLIINKFGNSEKFNSFIEEIATIGDNARYGTVGISSSADFLYMFIILCTMFRYEIIGDKEYQKDALYGLSFFGWGPVYSLDKNLTFQIVDKILHLVIEHGFSMTNGGSAVDCTFMSLFFPSDILSNRQLRTECPICKSVLGKQEELRMNQLDLLKYYRGISISPLPR